MQEETSQYCKFKAISSDGSCRLKDCVQANGAKGTGLEELAGKEDPIELDSSLAL